MSCTVYVYFKIDPASGSQLLPALRRMQAALAVDGISTSLLRRADEAAAAPVQTWMEVYQGVEDVAQFRQQMQQALACFVGAEQMPPRHLECFQPLE
jgi:predicted ABC-class ATPase